MGNSIKYPSIPQTPFWISEGKVEFFELEGLPVEFWRHVAVRGGGGVHELMTRWWLWKQDTKITQMLPCTSNSRGLNATKHPFSLSWKSLLHNIVQSVQKKNMVFSPTMPFNWYLLTMYEAPTVELGVTADPEGSISSLAEMKTRSSTWSKYLKCSVQTFITSTCTSLEQWKVNVGCMMCWTGP